MKTARLAVLLTIACSQAGFLQAQTTIGGGSCGSGTLTGTYALTLTGRQVTSAGTFTNVLQANGTANFDGLNKVTVSLTVDTSVNSNTPVTWSGTYGVQSNCAGTVTITSGGNATFNLVLYATSTSSATNTLLSNNFMITGNDATYNYSGTGNIQPAACSAATVSGVYAITGTGYSLSSGTVNGAGAATGLVQFDGHSAVTMNLSIASNSSTTTGTLSGSYSVSANCLGTATLTDSKGAAYVMTLTVYAATKLYSSNFYVTLAQNGKFLISGAAHAVYGQPTANVAQPAPWKPLTGRFAMKTQVAIPCRREWA
jgi:hypothetical protein